MSGVASPAVWLPTIRAGSGADVYVERLSEALHKEGLRAEITWLPHRAEYASALVPIPRPPKWANVVHVNSWLPRKFIPARMPLVVTVHHLVHDPAFAPVRTLGQAAYHKLFIRQRERATILSADAVVTVSQYVADTVHAFSGRHVDRVIPNWVNLTRYVSAQVAYGVDRPFILLLSGNGGRRKGLDLLPELMRQLGPGFQVRCTGGLRGGRSSIISGVALLGRLSERSLIAEYQACDAVLSLSRYEGFGLTAVEAMACGKPFVGFDTSGLSEVVGQGAGLLVPLNDVTALASAIRTLRDLPDTARQLGSKGQASAMGRYSTDNINAYITLYQNIARREWSPV
jgi:glycosyltransferase involved in cell wall biosynthesis